MGGSRQAEYLTQAPSGPIFFLVCLDTPPCFSSLPFVKEGTMRSGGFFVWAPELEFRNNKRIRDEELAEALA